MRKVNENPGRLREREGEKSIEHCERVWRLTGKYTGQGEQILLSKIKYILYK